MTEDLVKNWFTGGASGFAIVVAALVRPVFTQDERVTIMPGPFVFTFDALQLFFYFFFLLHGQRNTDEFTSLIGVYSLRSCFDGTECYRDRHDSGIEAAKYLYMIIRDTEGIYHERVGRNSGGFDPVVEV